MPAKRPKPVDECLRVIEHLRSRGASSATATIGGVEVCANFPRKRKPRDLQPAIGFHSNGSPEEEALDDD